ncbi:YciI family protein [Solirubrobacter taibaiensis]|nr:YciI family protein [Solirubrobacter taibaiensis]
MKFLALIYADETRWVNATPEEMNATMEAHNVFSSAAGQAGALAGGEALEPTTAATTVRVRDGERMLTDGPFAETKEQLGGYYVIEAADLDAALSWAAQIPEAKIGSVEVRPIIDFTGMEG